MNKSADELRNLTLALLANAEALRTAGKAAHERGRLLKDMARTTAVRFVELGFSKHRVWIRDFGGSLLGRI